jgi:diguanylate cyclase (GGDEF)-like protein
VDQKKALEFFFKLRTIIATTPIRPSGQKPFNFTASMGVTFSDLESVDAMLKHADKALYKAKQNGKNRVEVA